MNCLESPSVSSIAMCSSSAIFPCMLPPAVNPHLSLLIYSPVMKSLSRREFVGGLAAAGASTLLPQGQTRPGKINIHHHLTAPAYVKFLMDNKVRNFPNKSAAKSFEDID